MNHAVTTAADIWSLGCTIIELLNAEPPYYDLEPFSAIFQMIENPHPPYPAGISAVRLHYLEPTKDRLPATQHVVRSVF